MEQKYAIRKNHLDGQIEVHPRMRTVLIDWISEVHTQYHFAQETFHITVSIIDRYLQVSVNQSIVNCSELLPLIPRYIDIVKSISTTNFFSNIGHSF